MPNRKAKEGRDFKIYARNTRAANPVDDTSFEYFKTNLLDLTRVEFGRTFENVFEEVEEKEEEPELEEDELKFVMFASLNKDPASYKEAMGSKEKQQWEKAIQEELNSMKENDVWVLVDRSVALENNDNNIIDSKWVFKKKSGDKGKTKFKARLVIRGFKDINQYELRETYAGVPTLNSQDGTSNH